MAKAETHLLFSMALIATRAGNKFWTLNGGGSHARRAGFTRPTEFSVSYWGKKPNNPGYNSERGIWGFNAFGAQLS